MWPSVQLRRLFRVVNGGTPTAEDENWGGSIPWATPTDLAPVDGGMLHTTARTLTPTGLVTGSRLVGPGSLLLSTRAPIGYVVEVSERMAFNQGCRGLQPRSPEVTHRYYRYVLAVRRDDLQALGSGSTFMELDANSLGSLRIPFPPSEQQRRIVEYLDRATTRLDELISKKRQMVAVLEARRALASEELVLGLDADGTLATSRHFSHVPSGWRETVLGHLNCRVQTGPFGSQLHARDYVRGGWPVVNPANLRGGVVRPNPTRTVSDEKRSELARHVLELGDIVFGRRGEMGRAGLVNTREVGWLCGTGSLRLRLLDERISSAYLKLTLETRALRDYFELNSIGSTMDNLNTEIVLAMPILVPPTEVQATIVQRCERLAARTRLLVEALESQEALLLEHRHALIAKAVSDEQEAA